MGILWIPDEALENLHMLNLQEQRRKQLEHELDMNAAQINKQRLMIRQFEKDKDRSGALQYFTTNDFLDRIHPRRLRHVLNCLSDTQII